MPRACRIRSQACSDGRHFSKAIEQLGQGGEDKVGVRIGAIYSQEQMARDSPDELHGPIMETLTPSFVATHVLGRTQRLL